MIKRIRYYTWSSITIDLNFFSNIRYGSSIFSAPRATIVDIILYTLDGLGILINLKHFLIVIIKVRSIKIGEEYEMEAKKK